MHFVMGMELTVDVLLLAAVCRLRAERIHWLRLVGAAVLGSLYAGLCLLPGFGFLGSPLLHILSRLVFSGIAFGVIPQKMLLYLGLHIALASAAQAQNRTHIFSLLLSAGAVVLLCILEKEGEDLLPVELFYGSRSMTLKALQDTGNTLRDPITGQSVLVVDREVAGELTGLTAEQLRNPLETIGVLPGLRLIPYRTVSGSGFLLAMRLKRVRIGTYRGSCLVAFAPEGIGNGNYQALTGGSL